MQEERERPGRGEKTRERERERERDRQTDRQTHRERETETHTQRERERDRDRARERERMSLPARIRSMRLTTARRGQFAAVKTRVYGNTRHSSNIQGPRELRFNLRGIAPRQELHPLQAKTIAIRCRCTVVAARRGLCSPAAPLNLRLRKHIGERSLQQARKEACMVWVAAVQLSVAAQHF